MSDRGVYMYAVSRGLSNDEFRDIQGLRGQPLRVVADDSLCAVVSTVGLDEFGDEGLRRNLEDLSWLAEVARTHDEIVTRTAEQAVTAPLRLATICLDDASVRSRLRDQHRQLTAILDRVEGRSEWSVKAYRPPTVSTPTVDEPSDTPETGAAYLRRRRAETARTAADDETGRRLADRVHQLISDIAVDSRRLPPQDPRLTGHDATMTLNGAYLLESDRSVEIEVLVAGIAAEYPEAGVVLGGPWPPYTFSTLESP